MGQVAVVIAGKTYRMACGDGEEEHLSALAGEFDRRIADLHASFGEIGEMRLHVMAALTVIDELHEARQRLFDAEQDLAALRLAVTHGEERTEAAEAQAAEALIRVSERIEDLARSLNPHHPG